jgi:hypothetical protein
MRAKDFIPASKPRNFVVKNQKTAGAGAHKNKKRAEKQGDVKHKQKQFDQGVAEGSEIKIPTEDGITMQDIRLMAGEGKLTKKTILQAIAVIRKQRRPQGVAEGLDTDLVQIEYWQQETMESGRWVKTKPIPRATAEKIVNSFERGEIVDVAQGVAEGSENISESLQDYAEAGVCPICHGDMISEEQLAEGKKDACYHKIKASSKVWPSAYASGRLVQCRKAGAANYGKGKKK